MLLSIVMMVKNEATNLEKCFESLKPILNVLSSELVVLDTGSQDNTVEIAKQYTDKVYFHLWNNNFADMRNKSISYATGKWIFIIDADEILEDVQEIIDFFKHDKYKNYNTGYIKIKNYTKKNKYTLSTIARLFKKDKDFRYEGAIHEQPVVREPIYFFKSELIHYGYSTEDKVLMERKFKRNVEILKEEIDKHPENVYYWFQLSQSYGAHSYINEGLEAALKAYNIAKKKKINLRNSMYVYIQLALLYYKNKKYKELEDLCTEALAVKEGYLDLYYFLGHAQKNLYKDKEALKNYDIYLEMLPKYNKLPASKDITVTVYSLDIYEYVYGELCQIYTRQENYDKVLHYANKISSMEVLRQSISYFIQACYKLHKYEEIIKYYNEKIKGLSNDIIQVYIENLEKNINLLVSKDKIVFWRFFAYESTDYGLLNKIRINLCNSIMENGLIESIKVLNFNKLSYFYGDIIFYIFKYYNYISDTADNIREDKLQQYFTYLYSQYKEDFISLIKTYICTMSLDVNVKEKRLVKALCHFILMKHTFNKDEYKLIFNQYILSGIEYIREIYNTDVIENEKIAYLKSNEEAFLLYIYHAKQKQDNKSYINYLRKALQVYPDMKKGIELLKKDIAQVKQTQTYYLDEMELYKRQFKQNIQSLIEDGLLQDAKNMVDEYQKIVNDDIDVYSIKGIIAMLEGNMDEAESVLKKGMDIECSNCEILYNLAYLYELQEKYVMAYKYYEKVIKAEDVEVETDARMRKKELEQLDDIIQYKKNIEEGTKNQAAITIVTWAYNVERYIDQCARSVLNQSFTDFEWIILDNGCTDKTSEILNDYVLKDKRIKVFRNQNNSLLFNEPVNTDYLDYINGLESEYMCTLDSDDYLHPDFLKDLYLAAKKYNADIAVGGTEMFYDENSKAHGKRCPPDFYTDDITKVGDVFPQIYGCFRPIWGKLIRVSLSNRSRKDFTSNKIEMLNGADTMLSLYQLQAANSLVAVNKGLHYYRIRKNSHYNSQVNKNRYLDYIKIYYESKSLLKKWNKLNSSNLNFITNVLYYSMKDCIDIAINSISAPIEERIRVITTILSDVNIRKSLNQNNLLIKLLDEAIKALNTIIESHKNESYKNKFNI
ncbi:glycosyltransferase [Cellulosilyticum sp. I15G10I2]|uniref:glycosyltransferase n=1 Tax=Cellulosilyticum sp. I15G10I2 TaxID=1892843 RepID=UPI00085C6CCB|nr:glycosyltransferase [Cellulosilyticum sp. I15G10I2]